jgi:hypothetical protein
MQATEQKSFATSVQATIDVTVLRGCASILFAGALDLAFVMRPTDLDATPARKLRVANAMIMTTN